MTAEHGRAGKKQAREKLQEQEQRFRTFFENAGIYGYIVSPEGIIVHVNQTALAALGYARNELVGLPLSILYAEESRDTANRVFAYWQQTGSVRNAELMIRTRNGEKRWVLLNVDSVKDETGRIVHSTSVQVDITEQKKAEAVIQESETLHRTILESISDTVLLADDQGDFTYICPNTRLIFGYDREEIAAMKNVGNLMGKTILQQHELDQKGVINNLPVEIVNRDGQSRSLLVTIKKVRIQQGSVLYSCRDITERKRQEKLLVQKQAELEAYAAKLEQMNTALNVLIEHRDDEKAKQVQAIVAGFRKLVLPYLEMPVEQKNREEIATLFQIVKRNAEEVFLQKAGMKGESCPAFTPLETRVATLIRENRSTREIAEILQTSIRTVYFHRDNIRKKLSLSGTKTNLKNVLQSRS